MRIKDAVVSLGYDEDASQELCIASPIKGRMEQRTLTQCGERELESLKDVYIATGAFLPGSIKPDSTGRNRDNLTRIYDIPFDFDLTDYLGMERAELLASSEEALELYLLALQDDASEVLSLCDIPITTWISTGYGLCALGRLASPDQVRIAEGIALHAHLVERVNEVHGSTLADVQVKDAGTRLVRLPGCVNTKGAVPRPCTILHDLSGDDPLHIDAFEFTKRVALPPRRIIPAHSAGLTQENEDAIVLAVNNDYIEGSRHGIALGLGGMLAKSGVPRVQAGRITERIAGADGELGDRLRAIDTTYTRVERGLEVKGYTHLTAFLSPPVLAFVDAILDTIRVSKVIEYEFMGETQEREAINPWESGSRSPLAPCPEEAFHGWFAAYREIMKPTTEACDAYHLGTSLVYAGSLAGRRISTHLGRTLFPNLFLTLVGETGKSRKDTAMSRGQSFFQGTPTAINELRAIPFSTLRGVTSGEGLIDHLSENPRTLLYLSELSTMVRRARRQGTLTLMPTLIELWDAPPRVDLSRAGKDGLRGVDHPFLSLLAATTPQTLADDMSGADIESGFANRVLWVFGESTEALDDPPRPDEAKSGRLYNELREALALYPSSIELQKDDHARAMWHDWYHAHHGRSYDNEDEARMAQRMGANIHRVALLYAASEAAPFISDLHLGAATAFVEWAFGATREHARRWGWGPDAKLASEIIDHLYCGPMQNRDIARMVGERIDPTQLHKVLDALLKTGQVVLKAPGVFAIP